MEINGFENLEITHVHIGDGTITVTYKYKETQPKRVRSRFKEKVRDAHGKFKNLREKVKAIHDSKQ